MGSCEGVEICELVEIYLLSLVQNIIDKNNSGLYFHGRLNLSRNANWQKLDRVGKNVIKTFQEVGFKINIQTHLKIAIFWPELQSREWYI